MSRRHQGGRPHRANGNARQQAAPLVAPMTDPPRPRPEPAALSRPNVPTPPRPAEPAERVDPGLPDIPAPAQPSSLGTSAPPPRDEGEIAPAPPVSASAGCTAPQLRRFIKSRPYVPMHELRRRFGINGVEDEVSAVDLPDCRIFVGLPQREGALLGELLRAGDVGYELSLDPRTPIVVGLYPMRPVPRS
jgi:hypothetical protein